MRCLLTLEKGCGVFGLSTRMGLPTPLILWLGPIMQSWEVLGNSVNYHSFYTTRLLPHGAPHADADRCSFGAVTPHGTHWELLF